MTDTYDEFPEINNPHDKLFKQVFREKEHLLDFMRNHLPLEILEHMDMSTLQFMPGSFLEEEFTANYSDIIVRLAFQDKPLELYFLFEHKSSSDPLALWQLLNYMVRQWKSDLDKNQDLIPVIPVLFYHGEKEWKYSTFPSLFKKIPKIFLEYIPDFQYILHDISSESGQEIRGGIVVRLAQELMRLASGADPEEKIPKILHLMRFLHLVDSGERWMEVFLRYMLAVTNVKYQTIAAEFREMKYPLGEEIVMSTMKKILNKGKEQGIKQGKIEGKIEGKLEDARKMHEEGMEPALIIKITGLTPEQLKEAKII